MQNQLLSKKWLIYRGRHDLATYMSTYRPQLNILVILSIHLYDQIMYSNVLEKIIFWSCRGRVGWQALDRHKGRLCHLIDIGMARCWVILSSSVTGPHVVGEKGA